MSTEPSTADETEVTINNLRSAPISESDYDLNPTILYKLIEDKQWDFVPPRAKSNPEDVQTWIVRREKNGKLRWKLLPLHAVVIFKAPGWVVEALVNIYPYGAQCKDDQGMLPIHLAFRNEAPEDAIEVLLRRFPEGISEKDRKGRIPLAHTRSVESPRKGKVIRAYADAMLVLERRVIEEEQKKIYEEKLAAATKEIENETQTVKNVAKDEVTASKEVISKLKKQVESLTMAIGELTQSNEGYRNSMDQMKKNIEEMSKGMSTMINEQDLVTKAVLRQKEEMHAATAVRERMMMALINQEKDNLTTGLTHTDDIIAIIAKQKQRMETASTLYTVENLLNDIDLTEKSLDAEVAEPGLIVNLSTPSTKTESSTDNSLMSPTSTIDSSVASGTKTPEKEIVENKELVKKLVNVLEVHIDDWEKSP